MRTGQDSLVTFLSVWGRDDGDRSFLNASFLLEGGLLVPIFSLALPSPAP